MKWKICGMKYSENIQDVLTLAPDYMGFIFYPPSSRYIGEEKEIVWIKSFTDVQKVGVFVNASLQEIEGRVNALALDMVQLHGDEAPGFCKEVAHLGVEVMKAFSVGEEGINMALIGTYIPFCDYFLFDTKGRLPGGNGQIFNWEVLEAYGGPVPFFLSGGISLDNAEAALALEHPHFIGIDVNSRFEIEPAKKDILLLKELKAKIK